MMAPSVDSSSGTTDQPPTIGSEGRRALLPLAEAVEAVLEAAMPLPAEEVPLAEALGRVAAQAVLSGDDIPPFDNSAMDGYALRAEDTAAASAEAPVRLRVAGESRAGTPAQMEARKGEAIAISTGAAMPQGADGVARIEEVTVTGGEIELATAVAPGAEIRRAGEDVRAGQVVIEPGNRLGPAEVGVAASVGAAAVACAAKPRIAIVVTGDELVEPGEPLRPGSIRNSNAYALRALAAKAVCEVASVETVGDDRAATVAAIERGLSADVLVVSGGVSVGPHDHVKPAFAELGVSERFWGIALRPGRPTWFGTPPGGTPLVFGLPGNPVSAMVTFELLVAPALAAMAGASLAEHRTEAVLDEAYAKRPGRLHAVRCSLTLADDGWHARPTGPQGSHVLTSMLEADALAMIPAESGDVPAGARVEVLLLRTPAAASR
jgi:molybdopterin molybdotransferase